MVINTIVKEYSPQLTIRVCAALKCMVINTIVKEYSPQLTIRVCAALKGMVTITVAQGVLLSTDYTCKCRP